jgi:hypothetical protein
LAKRERERSTRKQAATMSVVTVATDHVGVSASDRPSSPMTPPQDAALGWSETSSRRHLSQLSAASAATHALAPLSVLFRIWATKYRNGDWRFGSGTENSGPSLMPRRVGAGRIGGGEEHEAAAALCASSAFKSSWSAVGS